MGHTYSNVLVHVVFSTRERVPSITEAFRTRLYEYLAGVAREEFGKAIKIGGTDNHLHALLSLNMQVAISKAICKWKSLSSGWVHKTIAGCGDFAWQEGYGAFSVSQSQAAKVMAYIEGQAEHHASRSFEEEFIDFLERHQVSYDRAHIWQ